VYTLPRLAAPHGCAMVKWIHQMNHPGTCFYLWTIKMYTSNMTNQFPIIFADLPDFSFTLHKPCNWSYIGVFMQSPISQALKNWHATCHLSHKIVFSNRPAKYLLGNKINVDDKLNKIPLS